MKLVGLNEKYILSLFPTSVSEYCWLIMWVSGCIWEYKSLTLSLIVYLSFSSTFPHLLSLLSRAGDEPSLQRCFIHSDTWPIWKSNNTVCTQYPGHSITRVVVVKKQQLSYSYSINNTTAQKHKQIPKCKHVHLPFVTQHSKMQYTSLLGVRLGPSGVIALILVR